MSTAGDPVWKAATVSKRTYVRVSIRSKSETFCKATPCGKGQYKVRVLSESVRLYVRTVYPVRTVDVSSEKATLHVAVPGRSQAQI